MANDSAMLKKSREQKQDEFYTLYEDIAAELPNYKEQFKGKRIICPCDWDESLDEVCVYASEEYSGGTVKVIDTDRTDAGAVMRDIGAIKCNFVKFLIAHAEDYGIKSISVSGYNPATGEGVKFQDIDYSKYDLCITNPPFSQVEELIELLFENSMQFLIIGPQTAPTHMALFRRVKENEMWMGYHYHLKGFMKPDGTILPKNDNLPRSCCWFTNLDVAYRHDEMILTEEYDPERYPKLDYIDAIFIEKTKDIPYNYDGMMAVPITFLQKYNPEQFEIIDGLNRYAVLDVLGANETVKANKAHSCCLNGKARFFRILIRNRKPVEHEE